MDKFKELAFLLCVFSAVVFAVGYVWGYQSGYDVAPKYPDVFIPVTTVDDCGDWMGKCLHDNYLLELSLQEVREYEIRVCDAKLEEIRHKRDVLLEYYLNQTEVE